MRTGNDLHAMRVAGGWVITMGGRVKCATMTNSSRAIQQRADLSAKEIAVVQVTGNAPCVSKCDRQMHPSNEHCIHCRSHLYFLLYLYLTMLASTIHKIIHAIIHEIPIKTPPCQQRHGWLVPWAYTRSTIRVFCLSLVAVFFCAEHL